MLKTIFKNQSIIPKIWGNPRMFDRFLICCSENTGFCIVECWTWSMWVTRVNRTARSGDRDLAAMLSLYIVDGVYKLLDQFSSGVVDFSFRFSIFTFGLRYSISKFRFSTFNVHRSRYISHCLLLHGRGAGMQCSSCQQFWL